MQKCPIGLSWICCFDGDCFVASLLAMTGKRATRSDRKEVACNAARALSLRGAKRRSNLKTSILCSEHSKSYLFHFTASTKNILLGENILFSVRYFIPDQRYSDLNSPIDIRFLLSSLPLTRNPGWCENHTPWWCRFHTTAFNPVKYQKGRFLQQDRGVNSTPLN